jgi:hypothetical protein
MRVVAVRGVEYVGLATALLQRMRLASATGGIWEAADIQWWSRAQRGAVRLLLAGGGRSSAGQRPSTRLPAEVRGEVQDLPHHLARRNGPDIAALASPGTSSPPGWIASLPSAASS